MRSILSRSCRIGSNSSPTPGRRPFSARARRGSFSIAAGNPASRRRQLPSRSTRRSTIRAWILLVSPSLRQSKELFAKVTGFLKDLEPAEVLEEDNKSCCSLANGARVVSLPGDPDTLRGYSAPKLIIKDEAAFVSDAMQRRSIQCWRFPRAG
jgi:hypothetical protein